MPEKQVYEYAFIRVVPRVERGEFLNVGVIVLCKATGFLAMKYHIDEHRLTAFSAQIDLGEVRDYLQAWDLICQGHPDGGKIAQLTPPERFRWITATKSTIVQCSSVHPGICTEPEEVVEKLFAKYVL
jgi:hypothetical protein